MIRPTSADLSLTDNGCSVLSSVIRVMRLPSSPINSMPLLFMAPMVSAATGMNEYDCVNKAYLVILVIAMHVGRGALGF